MSGAAVSLAGRCWMGANEPGRPAEVGDAPARHVRGQTPVMSSGDVYNEAVDGVVAVAADVPLALERLLVAHLVPRADAQLVTTPPSVPLVAPAAPRPCRVDVPLELGLRPRLAPVHTDVDAG